VSYPRLRSIDTQILAVSPFSMWLHSACCVSSLFLQYRESGNIKCPECCTSLSEKTKKEIIKGFYGIIFIHLELPERL